MPYCCSYWHVLSSAVVVRQANNLNGDVRTIFHCFNHREVWPTARTDVNHIQTYNDNVFLSWTTFVTYSMLIFLPNQLHDRFLLCFDQHLCVSFKDFASKILHYFETEYWLEVEFFMVSNVQYIFISKFRWQQNSSSVRSHSTRYWK